MARKLAYFVHVDGVAYGPGSEVPPEAAKKIGAHAWASDEDAPEPVDGAGSGDGVEAPPRSGRGSGLEAWRAFAEQNGVGTDSDMTREDIIAACEAAGVVEREE